MVLLFYHFSIIIESDYQRLVQVPSLYVTITEKSGLDKLIILRYTNNGDICQIHCSISHQKKYKHQSTSHRV